MKKITLCCIALLMSSLTFARDDVASYPVMDALDTNLLGDDISFYFGSTKHPEIIKTHGEYPTNKKTNAFNKSDQEACNWAFLSAMTSLRDRARKEGGNAIVNIRSNYKSNTTTSETEFKCGAGTFVAGVALIGTVVTVK